MTPPGQSTTSTNAMCEACTGCNLKLIYEYRNIYIQMQCFCIVKRVYEGMNDMTEMTDLYTCPLCCSSFPRAHTK